MRHAPTLTRSRVESSESRAFWPLPRRAGTFLGFTLDSRLLTLDVREMVAHGALVALVLVTVACASSRRSAAPAPGGTAYVEEGLASWYGEPYHGRPTASGPRYDMNEMTAAHRTLPFGTLVRVTNLENDKHTEVLINDRGPFVAGRIIDLSRAGAEAIEGIGPGVVKVRLEVVREGDGMLSAPCWEVQVGAFAKVENAERARQNLEAKGYSVRFAPAGGGLTRVRATGVGNRDRAVAAAHRLGGEYPGAVPVPCGGWS
jgi:rare lipoprotein A